MKKYHIILNKKSSGPYSLEELIERGINRETLIWCEGMEKWEPAGKVTELINHFPPEFIRNNAKKRGVFKGSNSILPLVLLALTFIVWIYYDYSKGIKIEEGKQQIEELEYKKKYAREHIMELVHAKHSDYTVGLLGGITGLKVYLNNSSDYAMDLVTVEIVYLKSSGGVFKTESINFSNVAPHSKVGQYAPESKRGTKVESNITLIKSKVLDL